MDVAVDRPFAQILWVLEQRHRLGIPDRYGHIPDAPEVQGTLEDGRRARLKMVRSGGWQLRILPAIEERTDGSFHLRIPADDEAKYLEKKLARLTKQNPGFRFEIQDRTTSLDESETFNFDFRISERLWPRFAIKVALNVAREIYGQDWLKSDHGQLLHNILWDRDTKTRMQPLPTRQVPWASSGWSAVPDHVLMAINTYVGPFLNIALFGEDTYGVPLGPDPVPYQIVWILHTHEERCERLTLDEFWGGIIGTTRRGDAGGGYEDG